MVILIFEDKRKPIKETKKEEKLPNYIVPYSNFNEAYLSGTPCRVVSEKPYMAMRKNYFGDMENEEVIDVVSLLSGIKYTIPNSFYKGYYDIYDAIDQSRLEVKAPLFADKKKLIGKLYYPFDNSYISDFEGNGKSLIGKACKVVSIPFEAVVAPVKEKLIRSFILVEYEGKIYRVLFGEWGFCNR